MNSPPKLTPFFVAPEAMPVPSGFLLVFALISVGAVVAIAVSIGIPLTGLVTRLRAQYNPKGIRLDPECDVQPHTGPVATSIFAMLVRVGRIEGSSGLYKGLMPTLLDMLMAVFIIVPLSFLMGSGISHGTYIPVYSIRGTLILGMLNLLIYIPLTIIRNRTITTPHKLPYFNAIYSLRVLLTSAERRQPWILYQTPGLFMARALRLAYHALSVRMRQSLGNLLQVTQPGQPLSGEVFLRIALLKLIFVLANTLVLTPLEVIFLRLSLQRNHHPAPEFSLITQEREGCAAEAVEHLETAHDENVIRLREEPYTGLVDCAKKIISEEGWGTLYRAWWCTMLDSLFVQ